MKRVLPVLTLLLVGAARAEEAPPAEGYYYRSMVTGSHRGVLVRIHVENGLRLYEQWGVPREGAGRDAPDRTWTLTNASPGYAAEGAKWRIVSSPDGLMVVGEGARQDLRRIDNAMLEKLTKGRTLNPSGNELVAIGQKALSEIVERLQQTHQCECWELDEKGKRTRNKGTCGHNWFLVHRRADHLLHAAEHVQMKLDAPVRTPGPVSDEFKVQGKVILPATETRFPGPTCVDPAEDSDTQCTKNDPRDTVARTREGQVPVELRFVADRFPEEGASPVRDGRLLILPINGPELCDFLDDFGYAVSLAAHR